MKKNYHFLLATLIFGYACRARHDVIRYSDPRIQYMGRIVTKDSSAELSWTATTVSIAFDGTGIRALLKDEEGDNYYNVIVDGKVTTVLHLDKGKSLYTLASGLPAGHHNLELFKRTEWDKGKTWFYGLAPDAHTTLLPAPPAPKRKLEFYGNSITCGYAVEDSSGKDRGTAPYENAYAAYASITGRHFNADYRCITKSGIGILISWFPLIMPEMWDRVDATDTVTKWDFSRWTPDVVVINLFQNDAWLTNMPGHEQFKARFGKTAPGADVIVQAYKKFVQGMREKYPRAALICMLGNMDASKPGAPWPGYIEKAVSQLDDKNIYTLIVPFKGTPGHPNIAEQKILADSLIDFMDTHIRW
ncbi:MAG TPA: SGNH/GDSL hydrolase family protein [Puia sp.]|nr:SGNH/GDSL hydrolase family protein [Puia sp.]